MSATTEKNKAIVLRFNRECVEQGNEEVFAEIVAEDCINHAAVPGIPEGAAGMRHFILDVLRPAFADLKATIYDQIAEEDLVVTRKAFHATHTGQFMGISPTHKKVVIEVIDIIRLREGKYVEHWGMSNIPRIIAELSAKR
jgi:predicted ester cyclase